LSQLGWKVANLLRNLLSFLPPPPGLFFRPSGNCVDLTVTQDSTEICRSVSCKNFLSGPSVSEAI